MSKIYKSKLYFNNKNSAMHHLRVYSELANDKEYPFTTDTKIRCVIDGKKLVFFREEDEKELLDSLNQPEGNPSFQDLIDKELHDEEDGVYF